MKQRITYVVTNPNEFSPEQVEVTQNDGVEQLEIKRVRAAKEHRVTLGLDELPSELSTALQQWHELHIKWTSSRPKTFTPPFTSRVSPGLHVFFTPQESASPDALCQQLHRFVDSELKCSSTNESSIKMPILSERFSMSTSAQYYGHLRAITHAALTTMQNFPHTSLDGLASSIVGADYLDVDYDTITRAVVATAVWSSRVFGGKDAEIISKGPRDGTVEIGVLMHEANTDSEDIQFGGFLTVLGQDSRPKATRFQAPIRHFPLLSGRNDAHVPPELSPLTYTTTFQKPTGLHPTLTLSFPLNRLTQPDPTCKLHTHLTLPSYLFIDKYQFTDPLFLAAKNIKALRSLSGATDLEAPDWVISQWGSAALFELVHAPTPDSADMKTTAGTWNISIPLHLRYLPTSNSSHRQVPVPWPVVFWACRAEEGAKMAANPFDRIHLGYEALFGPKTRFMHVQPAVTKGELVEYINVPVLDLRKTAWAEMGTVGAVVVAFLGLCWVLFAGKKEKVSADKKKI